LVQRFDGLANSAAFGSLGQAVDNREIPWEIWRFELHVIVTENGIRKWNPLPCGFYGDMKRQCRCAPRQIENYRQRISGPLLDRIDLHVEVPLVDFRELSSNATTGEKSETIRERVVYARKI
jgi:hypothetical protein